MYTTFNYKTKKAVKEDLALLEALSHGADIEEVGMPKTTPSVEYAINRLKARLTCYQPNGDLTDTQCPENGTVYLEGPHYPEPHRWYAQGTVKNRVLVSIK